MQPPPKTLLPQTSPEVLAEIERFQLTARFIAQGAVTGLHRATRRGSSIAFAEHKVYAPGDDIRHLDWHAFAKTDRYHIKQFEDETHLTLQLWIDHSASMAFHASHRPAKLNFAIQLAGALALLALGQGDAAGLASFAAGVSTQLPARSGLSHFTELATQLVALRPAGPTALVPALQALGAPHTKRQVIVILTDLLDPDPHLMTAFRHLAARRHDIAVLHILDPTEIDFNFEMPATFASMEDNRRLFVLPRSLKPTYVAQMQRFLKNIQSDLTAAAVTYRRLTTDQPPATALRSYLSRTHHIHLKPTFNTGIR